MHHYSGISHKIQCAFQSAHLGQHKSLAPDQGCCKCVEGTPVTLGNEGSLVQGVVLAKIGQHRRLGYMGKVGGVKIMDG